MLRKLQNLEILTVADSDSLNKIFRLDAGDEARGNHMVTQLKNLSLDRLSKLKHTWNRDPEGIFSFQTLQVVQVNECENLENIFPASVAKYLQLLEELDIRFWAILETIVAKEEAMEATSRFVFPQLFSLTLGHLSKLKNFYPGPGVQTIECPQLKRLDASNCPWLDLGMEYQTSRATNEVDQQDVEIQQPVFVIEKCFDPGHYTIEWPKLKMIYTIVSGNLEIFTTESINFHEIDPEDDQVPVAIQQPMFSIEMVLPKIEALSLDSKDAMRIWNNQYVIDDLFRNLTFL
ncbi:Disease resistance protein [Quillaja saponaria]|uniref:Disease resistance protein n=1 Tax=Quillaja saponaria TaxID=32244 RepID=A0AAD7KP28_QUISA|nr:Disease resistance protein [Quillaja saponaria]